MSQFRARRKLWLIAGVVLLTGAAATWHVLRTFPDPSSAVSAQLLGSWNAFDRTLTPDPVASLTFRADGTGGFGTGALGNYSFHWERISANTHDGSIAIRITYTPKTYVDKFDGNKTTSIPWAPEMCKIVFQGATTMTMSAADANGGILSRGGGKGEWVRGVEKSF